MYSLYIVSPPILTISPSLSLSLSAHIFPTSSPPQGCLEREVTSLRSALQRKGEDLDRATDEKDKLRAQLRAAGAEADAARGAAGDGGVNEASSSASGGTSEISSRRAQSGGGDTSSSEAKLLKGERRLLELQLQAARDENAALKKFLKDYGMVWVGDASGAGAEAGVGAAGGVSNESGYEYLQTLGRGRAAEREVRSGRLSARAAAARAKSHSPTPRGGDLERRPARASAAAKAAAAAAAPQQSPPAPTVAAPTVAAPAAAAADAGSSDFEVDIPKLEKSLKELNAVAGEGKGNVVIAPNGDRKLKFPTAMRLVLWRDGFQVDDAPFRSFAAESARAFVSDLVDGYFPYEMKDSHPDGVPFKLVNKTDQTHEAGFKAFSGQAARLDGGGGGGGGEGGGYALGGGGCYGGNVTGLDEGAAGVGGGGGNGSKRVNYLNKLPNAVIRNGKVIEVRSEIEAMLGGGEISKKSPEVSVIDTHLDAALPMDFLSRPNRRRASSPSSSSASSASSSSSAAAAGQSAAAAAAERRAAAAAGVGEVTSSAADNPDEVTTLRVKGMDGYKIYIIKLRFDDTIGTLRSYLERACSGDAEDPNVGRDFEIRGTYPPRLFDDERVTLRAAGLVPNAALLLRPVVSRQ